MWSSFRNVWITILLAMGGVLYFLGNLFGRHNAKVQEYRQSSETNAKVADFYQAMAEDDAQAGAYRDRDALVTRLRNDGL